MNKIIRFIQPYLLFSFPFVIACMIWSTYLKNEKSQPVTFIAKVAWQILSWNLIFWFGVLILFLILLVIFPGIREKTLKRLANLKERDEREEYITGKSARAAYISTLSLMIFFFFFSVWSLEIYRIPNASAKSGKLLTLGMNVGFSFFDKTPAQNDPQKEMLFNSEEFLPSKSAIMLILLCWQLLIFNLAARKEKINEMQ